VQRYFAVVLVLAFGWSAMAADDELALFKTFIEQHPRALEELKRDPSLIGSPDFAKEHKVVGEYLAKHPSVKGRVKAVPHFFDSLKAQTKGGEHRAHPDGDGGGRK
jgi:hypothetical protein